MKRIMDTETEGLGSRRTAPPLKVFRVARDLTQGELAALAGVSRRTILALEKGQTRPQIKTARAIAHVLSCQAEVLFPPNREEPSERETLGVQAERFEANPSEQKDRDASYPSNSD